MQLNQAWCMCPVRHRCLFFQNRLILDSSFFSETSLKLLLIKHWYDWSNTTEKKNQCLQTSDVLVRAHIYFVSKWKCPQEALLLLSTLSFLLIRWSWKNLDEDYSSCNAPASCQCDRLSWLTYNLPNAMYRGGMWLHPTARCGEERAPMHTAVKRHAELLHLPTKRTRESVRVIQVIK